MDPQPLSKPYAQRRPEVLNVRTFPSVVPGYENITFFI